ncbi:DUF2087 domain-containing protein [soil metagenome]
MDQSAGSVPRVDEDEARVVERFLPDGRLLRMPAKAAKRRLVLEQVAHRFEPGRRYTEPEVDAILTQVVADGESDHVTLRRYLVDAQLLGRAAGEYWRVGGWVADT